MLISFNQASYSSNFSTILRTSRGAKITAEFSGQDYSGVEPLPAHLAASKVIFASGDGRVDASTELLALHAGRNGSEERVSVESTRRESEDAVTLSPSQ